MTDWLRPPDRPSSDHLQPHYNLLTSPEPARKRSTSSRRHAAVGGPEAVEVAHRYYVPSAFYAEVMWPKMLGSRLQSPGRYLYSDIGMYMLKEIVERVTGQRLDAYVEAQFYLPLGARSAGFLPRQRFPQARIVPSENDTFFRHQLLCGHVHDPGAALAGGVAGHAGLFASAYDLAIIGQMLLNGGHYGGQWHLHPDTVAAFSARQGEASRRGLGFDRSDSALDGGYPSRLASPDVFGHTGFTGTALWVDPRQRLVFVFLSNRLLSPTPRAFLRQNVRPRVLDALYEALAAPHQLHPDAPRVSLPGDHGLGQPLGPVLEAVEH
ncbi:MAG: serine hydrolase [Desulfuromonadales bacterium]|nr:serine hydrolase [Desulfuromonadales bacterium]